MNALRHRAEIQSIECIDLFPNRFFDHNDDNIFLYRILLFLLDCDLVILFFFYISRYIFISSSPEEPRLVHHSIVVTNSTFLKRQNSTIRFVSDRS